jgi:hypothetical protein
MDESLVTAESAQPLARLTKNGLEPRGHRPVHLAPILADYVTVSENRIKLHNLLRIHSLFKQEQGRFFLANPAYGLLYRSRTRRSDLPPTEMVQSAERRWRPMRCGTRRSA